MLAAGCGSAGPLQVSIADVVQKPDVYVGDRITTAGVARKLGGRRDPYVLVDSVGNKLALSPPRLAAPHIGESVTVTGTFVRDLGGTPLLNATSIQRDGG